MPGRIFCLFVLLVCSGCAQPNYAPGNSPQTANVGNTQRSASDCRATFSSSGLCVSFAWQAMPSDTSPGTFLFKTYRSSKSDGSPILEDMATPPAVVFRMPSTGHEASAVAVQRLDVGTYQATNISFSMKDDWEIRFQVKSGDAVVDQAVVPYPACKILFSTSGLCLSVAWQTMPSETSFGSFIFKTYRPNKADGTPIPQDMASQPKVLLWMPSMGHGAPPVAVERLDTGTYQATNIFFTMKGDWEIRFQLRSGDAVVDQAVLLFTD